MQKQQYLNELRSGMDVDDVFVLTKASQGQARNGPFWGLTVQDSSGRMDAKIWSPMSQQVAGLEPGLVVRMSGRVESFRDAPQINVNGIEFLDEAVGRRMLRELVPSSDEDPKTMYARLTEMCRTYLHYPPWRTLVFGVLDDRGCKKRLMSAPGAKAMHHAYMGGLLEHTLSVASLCMRFCDQYPELDREVLLAAAVFHDLGKAWELTGGLANEYTDEGRLLGHIYLGLEILAPFLAKAQLDEHLEVHLKHLILSHHGLYEYGSPRRPKTREAMALHYADNMDAKMRQFTEAFEALAPVEHAGINGNGSGEDGYGRWTPYQRSLERFLYLPRPTPDGSLPAAPAKTRNGATAAKNGGGSAAPEDVTQCSLPLKG